MFVSLDDGKTWQAFQRNLPVTSVTDIDVARGDPRAGFMGYGAAAPDQPEWTPSGAQIDYWLGKDTQSATLEILDGAGKVVRSFNSSAPKAVPDACQVRLTVDGKSATQPLEVRIDPRLAADGMTVADLQAQFDLALRILAAMSDVRTTIEKVDAALQRAAQGSDVRKQLEEIQRALVTDPTISSYPQPMLADQFNYLYSNAVSVEQKVSGEMTKRLETLKAELEAHKARLEQVLRTIA